MTVAGVGDEGESVDTAQIAEQMLTELSDFGCLRGVGYYTPEGCERVYLREALRKQRHDCSQLLEDAALESVGLGVLEDVLEDDMTGTVRVFENQVVLYYYLAEQRGVVVSLDRNSLLDYEAVHARLERLVESAD